jgi:hypothetical protein
VEPESRYAIPFGIDSSGNELSIDETVDAERYLCPKCHELLEARKGQQLRYFAHWRNNERSFDCEAHSGTWGPALRRALAQPPSEIAARERRIRLAVSRDAYRPRLNLVGLVPAALPAEWDEWSARSRSTSSIGLLAEPFPLMFQPARVQTELKLNPGESEFLLTVGDGPPSLVGTWTASLDPTATRFVGDWSRAEARVGLGNLWAGQVVFLMDSPALERLGGVPLSLGTRVFRGLEVDDSNIEQIREAVGASGAELAKFEIRVVLPSRSPPFGLEDIRVKDEEPVLIHIVQSPRTRPDAPVDVLELPAALHRPASVPPSAPGLPRAFSFQLEGREVRRFDIAWNLRHVPVQANRIAEIDDTGAALPQVRVGIARFDGTWHRYFSTTDETVSYSVPRATRLTSPGERWKFDGPPTLTASVSYEVFDDDDVARRREVRASASRLAHVLDTALHDGASSVRIDFGVLGAVRLTSPVLTLEMLEPARLLELVEAAGPPEGHIRWSYIRKVLNLPSLDPHAAPGGTKAKIRRAVLIARRRRSGAVS